MNSGYSWKIDDGKLVFVLLHHHKMISVILTIRLSHSTKQIFISIVHIVDDAMMSTSGTLTKTTTFLSPNADMNNICMHRHIPYNALIYIAYDIWHLIIMDFTCDVCTIGYREIYAFFNICKKKSSWISSVKKKHKFYGYHFLDNFTYELFWSHCEFKC